MLVRLNPQMTFVYVSGAGTDSTERGPTMWARVKGATENALMRLPVQGSLHVPARLHPTDARRSVQDRALSMDLRVVEPACRG